MFDKFKVNLSKVKLIDDKDNVYRNRDLAEKVLINIANSIDKEIILFDAENTVKNDGWVEYLYVINLKDNTLGIYRHTMQNPIRIYKLDELPEEDVFIELE